MDDGAPMDRAAAHAALDELLDKVQAYPDRLRDMVANITDGASRIERAMAGLLFRDAALLAADICGPAIVLASYGPRVPSEQRGDNLRELSNRLSLASSFFPFEQHTAPQGSLVDAATEINAIVGGDEPVLFAKWGGRKVAVRVTREKLLALEWAAYLDGLGVDELIGRNAISSAYSHPWDTIARWRKAVETILGEFTTDYRIREAFNNGTTARHLPTEYNGLLLAQDAVEWQDGVARAGARYQDARRIKVVGRK